MVVSPRGVSPLESATDDLRHIDARPDRYRLADDRAWREHARQERARI